MSNLLNAALIPPTRKTVTESLRLKVPVVYPTGKPFFESIPKLIVTALANQFEGHIPCYRTEGVVKQTYHQLDVH